MNLVYETFNILNESYSSYVIAVFMFFYLTNKFYFSGGRCYSKERLDGKTAIVTGSNTGLGKETALDFAKRGAKVILACRDEIRAIQACDEIIKLSGNKNVIVEVVDLSSFKSIRDFAARINANENRLDILVNNAAVMACPKWSSKDGYELQLAVNHLALFLLTNLLLSKLKESAPSRIVNVNALAYEFGCKDGSLNLDDLNMDKTYEPWKSYKRSKICNILFTRSLSKRLCDTKVTVNALHPGIIVTEIDRYYHLAYGYSKWFFKLVQIVTLPFKFWIFKNVNQGAQTQIYCSVSEDLKNVNGLYFVDCKPKEYKQFVLNDELAEKVWKIIEELTNCKYD